MNGTYKTEVTARAAARRSIARSIARREPIASTCFRTYRGAHGYGFTVIGSVFGIELWTASQVDGHAVTEISDAWIVYPSGSVLLPGGRP